MFFYILFLLFVWSWNSFPYSSADITVCLENTFHYFALDLPFPLPSLSPSSSSSFFITEEIARVVRTDYSRESPCSLPSQITLTQRRWENAVHGEFNQIWNRFSWCFPQLLVCFLSVPLLPASLVYPHRPVEMWAQEPTVLRLSAGWVSDKGDNGSLKLRRKSSCME